MSDIVESLRGTLTGHANDDEMWERVIREREEAADEIGYLRDARAALIMGWSKKTADLEDEITRLRAEVENWKQAFAAQSRKLQSVLHIPGVREELRAAIAQFEGQTAPQKEQEQENG